jgi:hypothetical protein
LVEFIFLLERYFLQKIALYKIQVIFGSSTRKGRNMARRASRSYRLTAATPITTRSVGSGKRKAGMAFTTPALQH